MLKRTIAAIVVVGVVGKLTYDAMNYVVDKVIENDKRTDFYGNLFKDFPFPYDEKKEERFMEEDQLGAFIKKEDGYILKSTGLEIPKVLYGVEITPQDVVDMIRKGRTELKHFINEEGIVFDAYLTYTDVGLDFEFLEKRD